MNTFLTNRRQFLNRATVTLMSAGLGSFAAASFVAFLWPTAAPVFGGKVNVGDNVFTIRHADGKRIRSKITKVFEYSGLGTQESDAGVAGNIVGLSGFEDVDIGDTLTADEIGRASCRERV